jgi:hypothetical protein
VLDYSCRGETSALSNASLATYRVINSWFVYYDGRGDLMKGHARTKRITRAGARLAPPEAEKLGGFDARADDRKRLGAQFA